MAGLRDVGRQVLTGTGRAARTGGRAAAWAGGGLASWTGRTAARNWRAQAPIGRAAGRAARALVPLPSRGEAMGALVGVAALAGAASAFGDSEGPWRRSVFPTVQQTIFNDPNAVSNSLQAGLITELTGNPSEDVRLPAEYYYGRPVNLRGNPHTGKPVSGEMVIGMYNFRRGDPNGR